MKDMPLNLPLVVASIAVTALSWGVYGPVLHWGQGAMGQGKLRPLMCVGIAYFAIAVVVPVVLLSLQGWESDPKFGWTFGGAFWSLAAGTAGALGALGIIFALSGGGKPTYVMPLVFGCAPIVNTMLTITVDRLWGKINPLFAAGLILVAVGAVLVLLFKPTAQHAAKTAPIPAAAPASATATTEPTTKTPEESGKPESPTT